MDWGAYLKETWMTWVLMLCGLFAVYKAGTSGQWFWLIISAGLITSCFGLLVMEREKLISG